MARSGLQGGSAAVDSNTQLQKDYTQGLLNASQQAQTGTSALEQSDINSKNQLIGLAQQGNFTGTLPAAQAAQNASLLQAQGNMNNPQALGNIVAGTAGIYQNEETAAANRKAQNSPIGNPYGSGGFGG